MYLSAKSILICFKKSQDPISFETYLDPEFAAWRSCKYKCRSAFIKRKRTASRIGVAALQGRWIDPSLVGLLPKHSAQRLVMPGSSLQSRSIDVWLRAVLKKCSASQKHLPSLRDCLVGKLSTRGPPPSSVADHRSVIFVKANLN